MLKVSSCRLNGMPSFKISTSGKGNPVTLHVIVISPPATRVGGAVELGNTVKSGGTVLVKVKNNILIRFLQ